LNAIFDFILAQEIKEQAPENTASDELETAVKVSIDMLTIIFLHIVISKQTYVPPSSSNGSFFLDPSLMREHERRSNPLLAKVLKLDTYNIIMSLIKVDNLHLREHAIKILQLLIYVSEEFHHDFKQK